MTIVRNRDEVRAFLTGRQAGVRTTSDAMDQLAEQLREARADLQQARAEYADRIANARGHFDAEVAAMRKELDAAMSSLNSLRASMFVAWQRRQSDTIQ